MNILADLAKALEENDIALSEAERSTVVYRNLYGEQCERNAELLKLVEGLRSNITKLVDNQSNLIAFVQSIKTSENLFTLRQDADEVIACLNEI